MSIKDRLKAAASPERLRREDVTAAFPEGLLDGERLAVVEMTAAAADELDESNFRVRRKAGGKASQEFLWRGVRARYVAHCLRGGDGALVFDPRSEADLAVLSGLGKAVMDRLYEAARRVNGEKDGDGADPFEGGPDGSPSSESPRP